MNTFRDGTLSAGRALRDATALYVCVLLFAGGSNQAQDREGAHPRDAREQPRAVSYSPEVFPLQRSAAVELTHTVHGYHPYWIPDSAADVYRFDLLSHLAYFSCEIDPASGQPTNTRGWATSTIPARAKAAGVKVLLTVTNFGAGGNRALLGNPVARDTLCAALLRLVQLRNANGVSVDFEVVPVDQRDNLTSFFQRLRATLDAWRPGMVISAATPAVDWSGSWDVEALAGSIDLFFIMGYDYSWSGSTSAGPVAPLRGFSYNVERTVDWYVSQGVPASRLLLGVPYYGIDWPVADDRPQSPATDRGVARIYSVILDILSNFPGQWNDVFSVPWIPYRTSAWRQCWYDDARSLALKYQLVLNRNLAGAGIWALGYDGVSPELWVEIQRAFTRTVGINNVRRPGMAVDMWPMPLRQGRRFTVTMGDNSGGVVSLHDMLGREVYSTVVAPFISHRDIEQLCPAIPSGIYVARVSQAAGTRVRTVIVE